MLKYRIIAVLFIIAGLGIGVFDVLHIKYPDSILAKPFKLGLDLKGGVRLVYKADTSIIPSAEVADAMAGLRDVVERRVNTFGVGEPLVQVEQGGTVGITGMKEQRLAIELPGVADVEQAIKEIGAMPLLEFRAEAPDFQEKIKDKDALALDVYLATDLTGRYLKKARMDYNQTTFAPIISLEFTDEGGKIFAQLTKDNVGKTLAIFLDKRMISSPRVQEEITSGGAQITGQFTPQEAKTLVQRLNSGALPVPVSLISQQQVGPTLGERALKQGIVAGFYGFLIVAAFLILWYRLPGLIAVVALAIYTAIVLALFKLIPVTITAAGIAGFILSIGMAVDANVLIFERMKEEKKKGKSLAAAVSEGFDRAWLSIRDSNISSLISATILFWMGTSMVKGFALTLGVGVIVSMFTAITVSRTFLMALGIKGENKILNFLFGSGIK